MSDLLEIGSAHRLVEQQTDLTDIDVTDSDYNDNQNNEIHNDDSNETCKTLTRFKWTKEKSQVAMNLVKHGCKPKLVAVAVGCSLRTAQKFVETVTPKIEGESFRNYEIRRRGRKSKDVRQRLDAIRDVLSKDSSKTQVEIAADLKVSNTTVCRDLKKIGTSWKKKRKRSTSSANNGLHEGDGNSDDNHVENDSANQDSTIISDVLMSYEQVDEV